jgi:thiol-disulfide isomerase/thioredoxin
MDERKINRPAAMRLGVGLGISGVWLTALALGLCIAGARHVHAKDPQPAAPESEAAQKDASPEKGKSPRKAKDDKEAAVNENPFPGRMPAPGLEGGKEWLNTSGEITLKDLRGKVVLVDFWTYCCINCMHVLPDLKYLEHKYPKELVVIGVHSAKFDNEKETENIRRAILRYEIEHPVINDANMTIWRKYRVNSWPTLVLIDPEGNYCGFISGEGQRELLDHVVGRVAAYHRAKGTLDETPVRFDLERGKAEATPLRFPGKVLADAAGKRLFISDSNHNRIVIASLDGKVQEVIGTGAIGAADGAYDTATFDHPQGMALVGETLYVADTENHLLRQIDLAKKQVVTLAGTGEQDRGRHGGGKLLKTPLNSPWDLAEVNGMLYICMAGPHQIWSMSLHGETIKPYAGSGREDILNGSLHESALAQPSGITTDGKALYVVDSEGSAVRRVPLHGTGEVTTIVGTSDLPNGRCLFEFGDRDGVGSEARLQHPLGIVYHDGQLFVADSYNHKIKKVDLKKKSATTYLGTGTPGTGEDPAEFSEPAGLSIAEGKLYIADTNNHRIRVVDLATDKISTLNLEGLTPPQQPKNGADDAAARTKPVALPLQTVAAGDTLSLEVALSFPEDYKLNKLAPVTYRLEPQGDQKLIAAEDLGQRQEVEANGDLVQIKIPLAEKSGRGTYRLSLSYSYCRDGVGGVCKLKTATWLVPIEVSQDAKGAAVKIQAETAP